MNNYNFLRTALFDLQFSKQVIDYAVFDSFYLVSGNSCTNTRPANHNSSLITSFHNCRADFSCHIRKIHWLRRKSSDMKYFVAVCRKFLKRYC